MSRSTLLDLEVSVMWWSPLAVKVWSPEIGPGKDGVWLPISQVEVDGLEAPDLGDATVTLPKWLAEKVGLA